MKASANWLRELLDITLSTDEIARLLTRGGLEVEGVTAHGTSLEHVVIAEVRGRRPHPKKDRVTLVTVFDGQGEFEIVCGANNVPDPDRVPKARVFYARVGAKLPNGITIAPRDVGGITSQGMLCSEAELAIGSDAEGIVVLDDEDPGKPGDLISQALSLRDDVLELSVTPNRPDALGHLGIARELAAHLALGKPHADFAPRLELIPARLLAERPTVAAPNLALSVIADDAPPVQTLSMLEPVPGIAQLVPIRIEANTRCPRYLGLVVQNVTRGRSPFALRHRLHVLGLRSIDPVVDATNWILALTGNPVHAFDLEKLKGPEIVVRTARPSERFVALDGIEHTLVEDDLVIADAAGPVALAGVMGGKDSGVTESTKHVLLEVAYFEPRTVRRTARRHGFHTDASHRFERGVDRTALDRVMRMLATFVSRVSRGAPSPVIVDCTVDAAALAPKPIELDPRFVTEVIGTAVEAQEIRAILSSLGCASSEQGATLLVTPPGHRPDLLRPIDLVEEVARMRGYDRLESRLLRVSSEGRAQRLRPQIVRRIRHAATSAGLFEALTHALVTPRDLARARVPASEVQLVNPISEERAVLRSSLVPGLLSSVLRSERRGDRRVRLFELGRIYGGATARAAGEVPVKETLSFGAVLAGPRDGWLGAEERVDFWDGKGVLEALGKSLALAFTVERPSAPNASLPAYLHPQRAALVSLGGVPCGALGELHPDVADAFELAAPPIVLVLDGERLIAREEARTPQLVSPMPRFPSVERDLAIVVDESVEAGSVVTVLAATNPALIERVALFDVYRGKPIAEGKKSLAFRIAYRDPEATLTDAKVDALHAAALDHATKSFGAALRA